MDWFKVDRKGLAKLVEGKPKVFILHELLANAFDEQVTKVDVILDKLGGRPAAILTVTDDSPDGFKNLSDSWTLFAESYKKGDPGKRGRFNLGEKLVLAMCESASIVSTTGTVLFGKDGRSKGRNKTEHGTVFTATLRMNQEEYDEVVGQVGRVIVPDHITATFNEQQLAPIRDKVLSFECTLPTMVADQDGVLRRSERITQVDLYQPFPGEIASIYEMGIPVVETRDTYHANIYQKVPLNSDRDNVIPSFLQALRREIVNHTAHLMDEARATSIEVKAATSDPDAAPAAVAAMLDKQFGEKRFIWDPQDLEANNKLIADGYTAIKGGNLSGAQWDNVKRFELAQPAGKLAPTPKPYTAGGMPEELIPPEQWTDDQRRVANFACHLAPKLIQTMLTVRFSNSRNTCWAANYGQGILTFAVRKLGKNWFDLSTNLMAILDLILHEFAHEHESNHLSSGYHDALSRLGAKLAVLALDEPDLFPKRK